VTLNTKN